MGLERERGGGERVRLESGRGREFSGIKSETEATAGVLKNGETKKRLK